MSGSLDSGGTGFEGEFFNIMEGIGFSTYPSLDQNSWIEGYSMVVGPGGGPCASCTTAHAYFSALASISKKSISALFSKKKKRMLLQISFHENHSNSVVQVAFFQSRFIEPAHVRPKGFLLPLMLIKELELQCSLLLLTKYATKK